MPVSVVYACAKLVGVVSRASVVTRAHSLSGGNCVIDAFGNLNCKDAVLTSTLDAGSGLIKTTHGVVQAATLSGGGPLSAACMQHPAGDIY